MSNTPASKSILLRIYGDSISLPCVHLGLLLHETYPELLLHHCRSTHLSASLLNRAEAGKTIRDHSARCLVDNVWFGTGSDHILVIQCGVVDCAPRPLPPHIRRRLERKPAWLRKPVISFLHRNRSSLLRMGFRFEKVPPTVFKNLLFNWLSDSASNFNCIALLTIPPVTDNAEAHSPGWRDNINIYNNIIRDTAALFPNIKVVDIFSILWAKREVLGSYIDPTDGHHLQSSGHRLIFENIRSALAL